MPREDRLVIIEGAAYAAALSDYLQRFHNFRVVSYDGETKLRDHLDATLFRLHVARVALSKCHLTAVQNQKCSVNDFYIVDMTFKQLDADLVLAVGVADNSGILADAYARSQLRKTVHSETEPISNLLKWLRIGEQSGAAIR